MSTFCNERQLTISRLQKCKLPFANACAKFLVQACSVCKIDVYLLTGELIIVCLLCYRNFTLSYIYQEHFRHVHCAEFRFSCSNCGRGFWKQTTLCRHVCIPHEKESNARKFALLRDKMQQLKALNKPLFVVISPYKSDAAADVDENDMDNGNFLT